MASLSGRVNIIRKSNGKRTSSERVLLSFARYSRGPVRRSLINSFPSSELSHGESSTTNQPTHHTTQLRLATIPFHRVYPVPTL